MSLPEPPPLGRRSFRLLHLEREDTPALGGLALLLAFLFRDALLGRGVFFRRDVHLVWIPQVEGFVRAVLGGAWPVWDPAPAFGQPLLADPSAQVLYPPTWLNLLMRPWIYYTLFLVAHCLFSAWGAYRLSRHWQVSRTGAFVAASLWVTCGPFVSLFDLWHHFAGAAWIPWVLLEADKALHRRTVRSAVVCGLVIALQILAGSADMCAMTLLVATGGALVFHLRWRRAESSANLRIMGTGALALGTALAVSAGLWMTALDVVSRSARSNLPAAIRTYWSLHPLGLLELVIPGLWSVVPLSPSLRELLFESREPFLGSLYLGIPVLGLAGGALLSRGTKQARFLAACLLIAVLFALGRHLPSYDLAVALFPPLRILRYPIKAMVLAGFLTSLLAGMGFDAWGRARNLGRGWWAALLSMLALVTLVGLALQVSADRVMSGLLGSAGSGVVAERGLPILRFRLGMSTFFACLVGVLALLRSRSFNARPIAAVLATVALADRVALFRDPSPLAPKLLYTHRPAVLDQLKDATRVYVYDYTQRDKSTEHLEGALGPELARAPEGWRPEEASALANQMALSPATAGRWGLRTGYEIDYRGLHSSPLAQMSALLRTFEGSPVHLRLLRMASVSHAVALHEGGFEGLSSSTLPGLFRQPIRVFRIPNGAPRTFVASGTRVADGFAALETLVSPEFDPAREVILPVGSPTPGNEQPLGRSTIREERADWVRLEAELERPGYVVLTDGFDPGWQASLDGRPIPTLRANLVFRAVAVPEGRHVVEWIYRPWAMRLGLTISGAASLLALALLASRPRPDATPS